MQRRTLVAVCWIQVVIAAGYVGLNFYSQIKRPTLQMEFSRSSGEVRNVVEGGAADRAGIRPGDRILTISGEDAGPETSPLFVTRAGEPVPVVYERDGVPRSTILTPVTLEHARRDAIRRGAAGALGAFASYLTFPLHLWMMFLGAGLLALRPHNRDARISARTLVYWAGGTFLADAAGIGALFAPLSESVRLFIYLIDAFFIAGFFAECLHFALVFPSERTERPLRGARVIAYIAAFPIFAEAAITGLIRSPSPPASVARASSIVYLALGPAILIASLVVLAVRFRRMQDLNARRRLQLLFIALLPGAIGFTFSVIVSRLELGGVWNQIGRLANLVGTMASSGIYAYAVVRHRMFNTRFFLRRSMQYALARGTLLLLMSLPLIGLGAFLYAHRHDSVAVLLTGTPAIYLLLILPLFLVVRYRGALLEMLDRRYFREEYDARRLLLHVVSMIRDGSDIIGLSRAALDEIDRSLHPKHVSLWHLSADDSMFERGIYRGAGPAQPPPLPANGALPSLLVTDADPLDLYSRQTRGLVARLPVSERLWLGSTVAYLIVPLILNQRLVGMMVLGERLSEEPYSKEDRELLQTLASQLSLTLDYSRLKASPSLVWAPTNPTALIADAVKLCPSCGRCFDSSLSACEVDRTALVPEEGVPRTIDEKYIVTRLLGRGGMGSVYLATQSRLNRPVAIKVLLTHLVGSSSMQSRFEREARIVARLRHPGIVTIHDFGVLPTGHAYLVMEFLEGHTLRKTIRSGPTKIGETLEIIRAVGDAVESAHRSGVVHRDLKPENIMIVPDHDGSTSPRVLDFGLAKITAPAGDDEATIAQSGHSAGIVGTLMYMAPEALSGRAVDARSDQYSLALITYELLAGVHPFGTAKDLASVVKGHTDQPPPPIREVADVSEKTAAAIHRALEKNPESRFDSVGAFIDAL